MKMGSLVIKTDIDNSDLEVGLKDAERTLKQFEKEADSLSKQKNQSEIDIVEYENALELIKQLHEEELKTLETEESRNSAIEGYEFTTNIIQQALNLEKNTLTDINRQIEENAQSQENVKQKIIDINNQLLKTKNINDIKSKIDGVGKSVENVTKKVGRWALALFGIRSIYAGIRNAINLIASEDSQFKADLDYIKNAFLRIFEPAARRIVDLIKQLMYYVAYIIKVWTGKNIFENANKSLNKANASANKLRKTLAGFDEMNILGDNTSEAGGGISPSFDLTDIDNMPRPKWIEWIAKNGEIVKSVLAGITAGLIAMKLFGLDPIETSGVILFFGGLAYAIQKVIDYADDPSWSNFGGVIEGIGVAVVGLGLLFLGLPGIVAGIIIIIVGLIYKYWNEIQAFLQRGIDWLKEKGIWIRETFGNLIGDLYDRFVRNLQLGLNWLGTMMVLIKNNFNEIISFIRNVFTGDWQGAWQNIKNIFYNIWLGIKATAETIFKQIVNGALGILEIGINKPIDKINQLGEAISSIPGINIAKIPRVRLPRLAKGTILNSPGHGVPVAGGRALGGEAGREAYLPLSDEQLLEELGSSIGRHTTINLTVVNKMNGRVLNRETKKLRSEDDFAFNA